MHHLHPLRAFSTALLLGLTAAAIQSCPAAAQPSQEASQRLSAHPPEVATDGAVVSFEPFSLTALLSIPVWEAGWIEQPSALPVSFPAVAQAEPAELSLEAFRIAPRAGAGYSTSSGSVSGLSYFEAFVPLWQQPGQTLGFLEGQISTDPNENIGGGLLLGYRGYNADANRVRGGYLGIDGRGTDFNSYFQLGAGYESLGETWDFRFNAYLPLGTSRHVINDVTVDTGLQASTRFQGNLLLLESQRQRQRLLQTETALGGFDAEAGYRLAQWERGDLRGFGGVYLYGAPELPTYIGWRLRVASNFTPNFNAGLALQGDGLFGTRLVLSMGATFPGIWPSGTAGADEVRARLGEPTVRLPGVAIAYQNQSEFLNEQSSQPLQNPETNAPYWFQHVTLSNAAGGDGTFENPFGTVQPALDATRQDGNDVVYIDGASNLVIPSFSIPNRVQVLSQGPRQLLAGLPFPGFAQTPARLPFSPTINYTSGIVVELPYSGDGSFPKIENGVTLGNRTVLAGFRVDNAAGNAIAGSTIRDVELRNNTLTNPGERGIFLNDVAGSVVLFDNAVTGARGLGPASGQGILVRNTTTASSNEVTIAGFQASGNRVGIELAAVGSLAPAQTPNQVITIGPSSPVNTSVGTSAGTAIGNSASGNTNQGIRIQASTLGSQEVTITGATLSTNGGAGLDITSGTAGASLTAFQEIQVQGSTIASNGGAGIQIEANETAEQEFNIDGNRIVNNAGAGITSVSRNAAIQEFVAKPEINSQGIGTNVFDGNGGPGVTISTNNANVLLVEANQNSFGNNAGGADLQITSTSAARTCAVVLGNTGAPNLALTNNSSLIFEVSDLTNLSFNNSGAAVTLSLAPGSTFTNTPQQTCLQ